MEICGLISTSNFSEFFGSRLNRAKVSNHRFLLILESENIRNTEDILENIFNYEIGNGIIISPRKKVKFIQNL